MSSSAAKLRVHKTENPHRWYILQLDNLQFSGPMTLETIKAAIDRGSISWTDYAYHPEYLKGWGRVCEIQALLELYAQAPDAQVLRKFSMLVDEQAFAAPTSKRPVAPPPSWEMIFSRKHKPIPRSEWNSSNYWFFLINGKEIGPVDMDMIEEAAKKADPPRSTYAWNVSMRRWRPLDMIPELARYVGKRGPILVPDEDDFIIERGAQRRRSPRRSLVASVHRVSQDGKTELIGICGDISTEGFQLIQYDKTVPYVQGTRFVLEMRPSKVSQVLPFKLSAIVKWYDPERKMVGFQFHRIDVSDRELLSKYTYTE